MLCSVTFCWNLGLINKTHQAIWVHGNNNSGKFETAGGHIVPQLLEVTFVNRKNYMFEDTDFVVPTELDSPNVVRLYDVELGNWGRADG